MLESAARTLLDFGHRRLRAQLGVTAVLHTWTRDLRFHPHAHCIVTAGGLDDDGHWRRARSRYLFPVKAMSKVFRGKLLEGLARLYHRRAFQLAWPLRRSGRCRDLQPPQGSAVPQGVGGLREAPVRRSDQVFRYLGRYTHRVGLSNQRLVSFDGKTSASAPSTATPPPSTPSSSCADSSCTSSPVASSRSATMVSSRRQRDHQARGGSPLSAGHPAYAAPASSSHLPPGGRCCCLTGIDVLLCPACGCRSLERQPLPHRPSDTS